MVPPPEQRIVYLPFDQVVPAWDGERSQFDSARDYFMAGRKRHVRGYGDSWLMGLSAWYDVVTFAVVVAA